MGAAREAFVDGVPVDGPRLVESLAPYVTDDPDEHPWGDWMIAEAHADGLMPGAPNRWSGGKMATNRSS